MQIASRRKTKTLDSGGTPNKSMDVRAKQRLCLLACPLNLELRGGGFAPRHLNRSMLSCWNIMSRIIIVVFAITSIFGLQLSCNQGNRADDRINVMSPEVGAELVFFFKKGTTSDEIFQFGRTVTGFRGTA